MKLRIPRICYSDIIEATRTKDHNRIGAVLNCYYSCWDLGDRMWDITYCRSGIMALIDCAEENFEDVVASVGL